MPVLRCDGLSTSLHAETISRAFRHSIPVCFGYIPLGIAYGILFTQKDLSWIYATLSSVIVFAGSAQFLSVGLLSSLASFASIFVTTLLLNLRHVFYGLSVLDRYQHFKLLHRLYAIFGLTDETYSIVTTHREPDNKLDATYCFYVTLFDQIYWIAGSILGAALGSTIEIKLKGLDFTLTALFVVLLIEQAIKVRAWFPFLVAAISGALSLAIFPEHMLIISLSVAGTILFLMSVQRQAAHAH